MDKLAFTTRKIQCEFHGEQSERGVMGNWFGCQVCSENRKAADLEAKKAQARQENLDAIGLPKMYQDVAFSSWEKTDDRQIPVLRRAREHAESLAKNATSANLVLSGNTGTGKTHIASCIARVASNRMIRCKYLPSAELIALIRLSWDPKTRGRHESEIISEYARSPVLILDELGVGDNIKSEQDIWSSLFDQRYRNRLPTIITTNLTKADLKLKLGDRAYDRLMQNCIWANCIWESYRQVKSNFEEI